MSSIKLEDFAAVDLADSSLLNNPRPDNPIHVRHSFKRTFTDTPEIRYQSAYTEDPDSKKQAAENITSTKPGLGISTSHATSHGRSSPTPSMQRAPVEVTRDATLSPYTPLTSQATTLQNTPERMATAKGKTWDAAAYPLRPSHSHSSSHAAYMASSDQDRLNENRSMHPGGDPDFECPTDKLIVSSPFSWLSVSVLGLAIYSTVFSAIFLAIAIARPRYGHQVGTTGHISFSTASLLSALFSKTIELSFVTVFVAFLGQVLSRRAFQAKNRAGGISIAEMSMRSWIMQPGTLITHWEGVRYAAMTILGMIALTAALVAMLYTTAAEALVAPKLKFGPLESRVLAGTVEATFANPPFLASKCPTPISVNVDVNEGTTCLEITHAGQALKNLQEYMAIWANQIAVGNTSSVDYAGRPPPIGIAFDNTTITGQWIRPSNENITADSLLHKRLVQNLTMAMPHANVFHAARDPINSIMQPQDFQGNGEYYINAAVPAPAVNVLCAGMSTDELAPLIYVTWPNSNHTFNLTTWPTDPPDNIPILPAYPNETVVDDLFLFGPGPDRGQRAPIFPKYPLPYNTLVNGTGQWPADAVYIIAAPAPGIVTSDYLFCSVKAMLYPGCTTEYHAAQDQGQLSVHCDHDPMNTVPYNKSVPGARSGFWEPDWKNVGSEWLNAIGLGAGIADSDAAIARLLTQLVPPFESDVSFSILNPNLPSFAEAIGVLAGSTLIMSTEDSPFIHYWNYSYDYTVLEVPQYQWFNASLIYQDYASGGTQHWQGIFYVVLLAVFLTNVFCLLYISWGLRKNGQVTDYTEPQNLFALAMNSPPSRSLSGACGGGPDGDMLSKKWEVDMAAPSAGHRGHPHFYVKCRDDERAGTYIRVRERKSKISLATMDEYDVMESPAVGQYRKLANSTNPLI